jgi:hypothetical protein
LDQVPAFIVGRAFADAWCVLHVNRREVGRGPGGANPHSPRYDSFELAGALHVGTNVINDCFGDERFPSRN